MATAIVIQRQTGDTWAALDRKDVPSEVWSEIIHGRERGVFPAGGQCEINGHAYRWTTAPASAIEIRQDANGQWWAASNGPFGSEGDAHNFAAMGW